MIANEILRQKSDHDTNIYITRVNGRVCLTNENYEEAFNWFYMLDQSDPDSEVHERINRTIDPNHKLILVRQTYESGQVLYAIYLNGVEFMSDSNYNVVIDLYTQQVEHFGTFEAQYTRDKSNFTTDFTPFTEEIIFAFD